MYIFILTFIRYVCKVDSDKCFSTYFYANRNCEAVIFSGEMYSSASTSILNLANANSRCSRHFFGVNFCSTFKSLASLSAATRVSTDGKSSCKIFTGVEQPDILLGVFDGLPGLEEAFHSVYIRRLTSSVVLSTRCATRSPKSESRIKQSFWVI